jgi:hypothetical protein
VDFSATYAFCPAKPYFLVLFWGKIFFCVPFNACAAWPPGQSKKLFLDLKNLKSGYRNDP